MRTNHRAGNFCPVVRWAGFSVMLALSALVAPAQSDPPIATNQPAPTTPPNEEQVRKVCIEGRRMICGRVLQVSKEGLVVDSGYTALTQPPFDKSWVVRSNVKLKPDPHAVEGSTPGAPCVGLVFLADLPKRPTVKCYDYVVLQGYPAGTYVYSPVPSVLKTIRKFTGGLATAVTLRLKDSQTK